MGFDDVKRKKKYRFIFLVNNHVKIVKKSTCEVDFAQQILDLGGYP